MGIFKEFKETTGSAIYEGSRPYIKENNGKVHCIVINCMSKMANNFDIIDDSITLKLESFTSHLQDDGHEIISVIPVIVPKQGTIAGLSNTYSFLITYK